VKERPDVLRRYFRAYAEAVKFMRGAPEQTKKVIAKYTATSNRDDLDESYRVFAPIWEKVPYMSAAAIQTLIDFSQHPGAKTAKPAQFIDNTFAAELERSGFIDQLYKQ
jgi:ABC-type nitrate/sulfonate/bicarbonate transport system substrate-binding protein